MSKKEDSLLINTKVKGIINRINTVVSKVEGATSFSDLENIKKLGDLNNLYEVFIIPKYFNVSKMGFKFEGDNISLTYDTGRDYLIQAIFNITTRTIRIRQSEDTWGYISRDEMTIKSSTNFYTFEYDNLNFEFIYEGGNGWGIFLVGK